MEKISSALKVLFSKMSFSAVNLAKILILVIAAPILAWLSFYSFTDRTHNELVAAIYTITNLSIFLSYTTITIVIFRIILLYYVHKTIRNLLEGFAFFVALSGVSHLFEALNVYYSYYVMGSTFKCLTAIISGVVAYNFFIFFKEILSNKDSVHYLHSLDSSILRKVEDREVLQEDVDAVKGKLDECSLIIREMNEVLNQRPPQSRSTSAASHQDHEECV